METHGKKFSWMELVLWTVLALSQVQCSQSETWNVRPGRLDNTGETQGGNKPWVEIKTLNYEGRFHAQALFVLDNSGSMREEIADYVEMRVRNFMAYLDTVQGLTYQVGITNTNFNVLQGRLLSAMDGTNILTRRSPVSAFASIMDIFVRSINEPGSGTERGLASSAAAITRDRNTLFGEPPVGASLSRRVIIVSDMDDTDRTPIETYTDVLRSVPQLSLHPIIAIPGNPSCVNPVQEGFGVRYAQAVERVGGQVNSICAPDFEASLSSVFEWIQNVCIQLDTPVGSRDQIRFFVDEVETQDFSLDDPKQRICVSMPNRPSVLRVEAQHPAKE